MKQGCDKQHTYFAVSCLPWACHQIKRDQKQRRNTGTAVNRNGIKLNTRSCFFIFFYFLFLLVYWKIYVRRERFHCVPVSQSLTSWTRRNAWHKYLWVLRHEPFFSSSAPHGQSANRHDFAPRSWKSKRKKDFCRMKIDRTVIWSLYIYMKLSAHFLLF